jgi:hypothetical protein
MAWTRASLGFLANGVLLMLKYVRADAPPISLLAAGFATAATLWMYLIGRRRQQLLARQPLPAHISPRREVYEASAAVIMLIALSVLSLLV